MCCATTGSTNTFVPTKKVTLKDMPKKSNGYRELERILKEKGFSYDPCKNELTHLFSGNATCMTQDQFSLWVHSGMHDPWSFLDSLEKKESRIQFGKHKGKLFSEIPQDYLEWLLENMRNENVLRLVEKELSRRKGLETSVSFDEMLK